MYASSDVEMTSEAIIAGAVSSYTLWTAKSDDIARLSTPERPTTTSTFSKTVPHLLCPSQLTRLITGLDNLVSTSSEPA